MAANQTEHSADWGSPPAFVLGGVVQQAIASQPLWQPTLASMRLVNRDWRRGAGAALVVLSPRPLEPGTEPAPSSTSSGSCAALTPAQLAAQFPGLLVLLLRHAGTAERPDRGPSVGEELPPAGADDALLAALAASALAPTLRSLHLAMPSHTNPFRPNDKGWSISAAGLACCLPAFQRLAALELQAPWGVCADAAAAAAALSSLRRLALLPGYKWNAASKTGPLLPLLTGLTGLRSLTCSAQGATAVQLSTLGRSLTQLSSLDLRSIEEGAALALPELAGRALRGTLRRLSVQGMLQFGFLRRHCVNLPAEAFAELEHLEAPWLLLLGIVLPSLDAQAPDYGALPQLTSLALDMEPECYDEDEVEGGEEIWREEERRWQLLPAWLFGGGAPRLRRLRLENAMGGCGPNIWEPDMVQGVSTLEALTQLTLQRVEMEAAAVTEGIALASGLRELELGLGGEDCPWPAAAALARLPDLTKLEAVCEGGGKDPGPLVAAVTQLTGLRQLALVERAPLALGMESIEAILAALPRLELLQTSWGPGGGATAEGGAQGQAAAGSDSSDSPQEQATKAAEERALCERHHAVLQHSVGRRRGRDTLGALRPTKELAGLAELSAA